MAAYPYWSWSWVGKLSSCSNVPHIQSNNIFFCVFFSWKKKLPKNYRSRKNDGWNKNTSMWGEVTSHVVIQLAMPKISFFIYSIDVYLFFLVTWHQKWTILARIGEYSYVSMISVFHISYTCWCMQHPRKSAMERHFQLAFVIEVCCSAALQFH